MALSALAAVAALGADISVIQSSATQNWAPQPALNWGPDFSSSTDVTVDTAATAQTILGFGGALTDTTAWNVMVGMNETLRQQFLTAWYDAEQGLGYHVIRITLNSADYSVESFNYDNTSGDFSLSQFDRTLAYDNQRVIPLIRLANATAVASGNGPLKLFASPWSPPGWMKTNNNMIDSAIPCLKNDTSSGSYRQTWADYMVLWLQSMAQQGIDFWGLTPQNEPLARQPAFESCYWDGPTMAGWVRDFLGPAVKTAFPDLNIMLYDHNKVASFDYVNATAADPQASRFIDGVALHWYDYEGDLALDKVAAIQSLPFYSQPGPSGKPRFMLNTEACDLQHLYPNYTRGELFAVDLLGDLNYNVSGYVEWNHILHSGYPTWMEGGPNHDNTTSFGNTGILYVDASGNAEIRFQSWYWMMGHVSRFARPGSVRVQATGAGVAVTPADYNDIRAYTMGQRPGGDAGLPLVSSAFVSEDGSYASVVVMNPSGSAVSFKLRDLRGGSTGQARAVQTSIPAHSIQTYTYSLTH